MESVINDGVDVTPSLVLPEVQPEISEKLDSNLEPSSNCSPSCTSSAEDEKPKVDEQKKVGESVQPPRDMESPEPSCSICLGKMENKSFTNSCFHQFCFSCLLEWSKVKPECPLCKQPFKSIVHNVRSMEDYDQYDLRLDDLNTWENPDGRRFRYRSTLTSERRRELALGRFMRHRMPSRTTSDQPRSSGQQMITTSDYRRHLYECGLYARAQPATRSSRYRESSPAFYSQNPACTHRLIPWLNRELNALDFGHQVAFLMELILSLIHRFPIQSPEFQELVQPYFLRNTDHFIHEFYNFARSPYDMVDYDRHVAYSDPTVALDGNTGSDTDVIVISQDVTDRPRWSRRALQSSPRTLTSRDQTSVLNRARDFLESISVLRNWGAREAIPSTSGLSRSTISLPSSPSSPEPGPSGLQMTSTRTELPSLRSVVTIPPNVQRVKMELTVPDDDDNEDCMIVGYQEPLAQRSPVEVIVLTDSDDDVVVENVSTLVPLELPESVPGSPSRSESQPQQSSDSSTPTTKKVSKHKKHKSKKRSRSRSRSESLQSPQPSSSHSRHHHHKHGHKHRTKSRARATSLSSPTNVDKNSPESSHPRHKSSKKKHSHKHKRSKSCESKMEHP